MGSSSSKTVKKNVRPITPNQRSATPNRNVTPVGTPGPVTKFTSCKDVMISYSHQDIDIMRKVKGTLEKAGVSVWVDESALTPGAVFLREIGEAIVASRLFIVLLSADSVQSKYCQDEVSLAYISNKNIFAVSILPFNEVSDVMDLGMKLTLACVHWSFLNENPEESLQNFVGAIKSGIERLDEEKIAQEPASEKANLSEESTDEDQFSTSIMNKQALNYRLKEKRESFMLSEQPNLPDSGAAVEYWKQNFGDKDAIEWAKFSELVQTQMSEMWKDLGVPDDTLSHLFTLMKKEMKVFDTKLMKNEYLLFCKKGKQMIAFDEAIKLYAAEAIAVREVFDIGSSVRLTAIENLGDHKSKKVIKVLLDLLYDEEHDVRVVAAIALAHAASDIRKPKVRSEVVNALLGCLNNDDRLVRESGCLALGRMKSKTAIKKLVFLWRNDYISTVREAAQIAIKQIGGDEAEQALHVTKVLSEEIQQLKT
uniref:G patch domain-containing protein 3 n=1 Tax=Phallusia mammillata TaxID=59560 RepID=A0A6F9DEK5_9ASCI|nr:G patch domain-containing protein 3 [Phallusia mammillata]